MSERPRRSSPYMDVPAVPAVGLIDVRELLPGEGPLELEIGFGRGRFMLDRAVAHPEVRLLGLETRRKWVHVVAERAAKAKIENVCVRYGDARVALPLFLPDGGLDRVFINFPDPWWKARHEKRMVVTAMTVEHCARLLRDGGELFLQTDVDFRAEAYQRVLSHERMLEPVEGEDGFVDENPMDARSLREIRCEETGLPVYRMLFRRRSR